MSAAAPDCGAGGQPGSDRELIDITPTVSPALKVFPGDTPFSRELLLDIAKGHHITLSTIRATLHLGAHADAPSHYGRDGATIDRLPLSLFAGECRVMHTPGTRGRRVRVSDLTAPLDSPRILLRTDSHPDPHAWPGDFSGLEPALVDHLAQHGVRLVGIDTPSVDPADSKDLPAHARFLATGMIIVEGLDLSKVVPGRYEFLGLPLKLAGCDASPIRAALRRL